jgi:hypothetical protein
MRSLMARDEQDPGALADEMEQEADRLEDRSKELGEEVQDVRQDWERKRADEGVPGANPPEADERSDQDESEDQTSGQGSDVPPDREAGRE